MASQGLFHCYAPPVISSNASATRRSKEIVPGALHSFTVLPSSSSSAPGLDDTQVSRSLANAAIFHAASNAARNANGTVRS